MTTDLHEYAFACMADIRNLARAVATIARNTGNEQTAEKCDEIADDILESYNQLKLGYEALT